MPTEKRTMLDLVKALESSFGKMSDKCGEFILKEKEKETQEMREIVQDTGVKQNAFIWDIRKWLMKQGWWT